MTMKASVVLLLTAVALTGCDHVFGRDDRAACAAAPEVPGGGEEIQNAAGSGTPEGNAKDMLTTQQRAISTVVQQLTFQLCTARMSHWIDDQYYRQELTALREESFAALGVKGLPSIGPAPAAAPADDDGADNQASANMM